MATTLINNMHIFSPNHANSPVVKYEEQPSPTDYYSDCTSDATVTTIPAATKEEKKTTSMQQDWSLDNQLCDHENTIMQSYLEPESIHSKSCINYVPSSPCSSTVSPHYCFKFSSIKSKMKKVFRFSSSVKLEKHQQQSQRSYHKEEEKLEDEEEKKSITVCSSLPNLVTMSPSRAPSMDSVCTHSQRYHPVEKQGEQGKVTRIKKQFSRNSSVSDIAFSSPHHYNHHYHQQHHHHHEIPLPPLPPKGILKKNRSYYNRPMSAIEIASSQASKQQKQQQQQQQQLEKQTKTPPQRHSFLFLLNRRNHKTSISSATVGRIRFNKLVSVHETWSKQDYDRGSDPDAVCTRLTSELAHHIKQELNFYKLHEMTVHDSSRINTHFFL